MKEIIGQPLTNRWRAKPIVDKVLGVKKIIAIPSSKPMTNEKVPNKLQDKR